MSIFDLMDLSGEIAEKSSAGAVGTMMVEVKNDKRQALERASGLLWCGSGNIMNNEHGLAIDNNTVLSKSILKNEGDKYMNTKYDLELQNIPVYSLHQNLLPFIGDLYEDYRLLHIGESHYIPIVRSIQLNTLRRGGWTLVRKLWMIVRVG